LVFAYIKIDKGIFCIHMMGMDLGLKIHPDGNFSAGKKTPEDGRATFVIIFYTDGYVVHWNKHTRLISEYYLHPNNVKKKIEGLHGPAWLDLC
jgi:hypothetical protein